MTRPPAEPTARDVFDRIQRAVLEHDASLAELYAPDAVHEWPFPFPGGRRRLSGLAEIREYFARLETGGGRFRFEGFGDVVVHDTVDPETLIAEYQLHGTVLATGKPFTFSYVAVLRVRDGRIVYLRDYLDPLAMTRAASAPPPSSVPAGPAPEIPDGHADLLARPLFARVATVRPDGAPQNSVMWFGWDGEHVKLVHSRRGQKYRNVSADPRVSVSLADPDIPYRSLEIRGVVTEIADDPGAAYFHELAARHGYSGPVPSPDDRVVLSVRPVAVTTTGPAAEAGA